MSETHKARFESPIGTIEITAEEKGIVALAFVEKSGLMKARPGKAPQGPKALTDCLAQLDEYFRGRRKSFSVPLRLKGTAFQKKVWSALRRVPFGKTATYGEIAAAAGNRRAGRAVGGANHRNPVSIIVPCHRIIGAGGGLTGYGGGLWRKEWLLAHERKHARD